MPLADVEVSVAPNCFTSGVPCKCTWSFSRQGVRALFPGWSLMTPWLDGH